MICPDPLRRNRITNSVANGIAPDNPVLRNADDLEEALARAASARQRHRALCQSG